NIIFADADLDQAVNGAMMGIFFNQGQVCCAGSRLFVEEKVKDEFLGRFKEKAERITVGDPMDKATLMGPQVSEEQLTRSSPMSALRARKARRYSPAVNRRNSTRNSRTATFFSRRSSAKLRTRCAWPRKRSLAPSRR